MGSRGAWGVVTRLPPLVAMLALGVTGSYVACRLRIPAGRMLGPMVLVGAAALAGLPLMTFPSWMKTALQVMVGTLAGARITRRVAAEVRLLSGCIALVTAWLVSSALLIGYLLALWGGIDLATALLGCSPGGLAEMTSLAIALGADAPVTAVLQTCRLVGTMLVVPLLARNGWRRPGRGQRDEAPPGTEEVALARQTGGRGRASHPGSPTGDHPQPPVRWLGTLALGAAGAALLSLAGVPGGPVTGSLLAVAAVGAARGHLASPPEQLRRAVQIAMGMVVGTSFSPRTLVVLKASALVILLATAATLVSGLALGGFLQRRLRSDAQTALLACAPAGLSHMVVIADELGADVQWVTVFQLIRLVCAVVILPLLFRLLL